MGATTFYAFSEAETASEAFSIAVTDAQYMHGHGGYTGTIAEKSSYTLTTQEKLPSKEAYKLANSLIDTTYSDKWGPAGCIQILTDTTNQTNKFLFFGWASE